MKCENYEKKTLTIPFVMRAENRGGFQRSSTNRLYIKRPFKNRMKLCLGAFSALILASASATSPYCQASCRFSSNGRTFDLSSLCKQDGSGYLAQGFNYNVDSKVTPSGHTWNINICGTLKNQCSQPQFCADTDGNPTFEGATQCVVNPQQAKVGMAIQQSWTQECPESTPPLSCTRCEVAADKPTQGTWSVMNDGDTPDPGVRVMYPLVPETANEDGSWNSCTDINDGRIVTYEINCDCDKSDPIIAGVYSVMEQCNYTIKVHAKAACPTDYCSTRSGGTKFLIAVVVIGILYVGVAFFVNHRQTGSVGIPESHRTAVRNFFALAGEGARYVASGGKSAGGGGTSSGGSTYFSEFKGDGGGEVAGQPAASPSTYTDL